MNNTTLIHSSILAAIVVAAIVGASILTGFPAAQPFISVDPIGDKNIGDTFTVTGTTSLPAGSEILFEVAPASLDYNTGMVTDPVTGASVRAAPYVVTGMLKAGQRQNGIALWSFTVDSSSFMTGKYRANVMSTKDDKPGDVSGNKTFTVRQGMAKKGTDAAGAGEYVRINPVRDRKSGEALTVTGTTNLPNGTNLLVQVFPASFEQSVPDTGVFSGAMGGVDVRTGSGGVNTWSMDIDTSQIQPTKYVANVSVLVAMNPPADVETRDPSDRTMFTILPGSGNAGTSGSPDNAVAGGILIDPIRDTVRGDILKVTGKTNLSAGTDLLVKVIPASFDNKTIAGNYRNPENAAVITVIKSDSVNNRFSVSLDTRFLPLSDHIITVSEMKDPAAGIDSEPKGFTGSAIFNIIAGTATTSSGQSVTDLSVPDIFINPVDDVTSGETIVVTGTTNVPAGSEFRISLIPASMDNATIQKDIANPKFSTTAAAVKGSATANLFSATVPTKGLPPGQYILVVSAEKEDVTGSVLITVK